MRHYTLVRTVVKAEDVEKASVSSPEKPDQGDGKEHHSEERASEPSNDNDMKTVDVDEKRTLASEGHV